MLLPVLALCYGAVILLGSISAAATVTSTELIKDWALCNNGEEPGYDRRQCVNTAGDSLPCDSRKIPDANCTGLKIHLHKSSFNHKDMEAIWKSTDRDSRIRRVIIKYNASTAAAVHAHIDGWLMHRLWWFIEKETFAWQDEPVLQIVLHRYHHAHEGHLRWLSAVQYPPADICDQSPLVLGRGRCVHPGYAAMMGLYTNWHYWAPYSVFGMHVSTENNPREEMTFISAADCVRVNRWTCAFLPTTNCTIPDIITKCNTSECVDRLPAEHYSIANASGQMDLRPAHEWETGPHNDLQRALHSFQSTKEFPYLTHDNRTGGPSMHEHEGNPFSALFVHMLILRPNLFYRERIARVMSEFAEMYNFQFGSDRCIAAHIRRGDRSVPYKVEDKEALCKKLGEEGIDLGCEQAVMFSQVTLAAVLRRAQMIAGPLPIRHLIVATDDYAFVEKELRRLTASQLDGWRVLPITPPESFLKTNDYSYFRSNMGTMGGVHFISSIKILQQCEGLVAHEDSSVAELFEQAMCVRHYKYMGVCPYAYNVARGLRRSRRRH